MNFYEKAAIENSVFPRSFSVFRLHFFGAEAGSFFASEGRYLVPEKPGIFTARQCGRIRRLKFFKPIPCKPKGQRVLAFLV
jgi:hypothetical protein